MVRLVVEGFPPSGIRRPGRNEPCLCDSGVKFKRCCLARTVPPNRHVRRLLVVGAGATIEECLRSGSKPNEPLPGIATFGQRLFNESHSLQKVAASYLQAHGIAYESTILEAYETTASGAASSVPIPPEAWGKSPLRIFLGLERDHYKMHNVERLFEHVWNTHGDSSDIWEGLAYCSGSRSLAAFCSGSLSSLLRKAYAVEPDTPVEQGSRFLV
jgi:hypothetical protein